MSNTRMIILIAVALAFTIGLWMFARSQKTRRLRSKFGPEYDRMVSETGGKAGKAEAILDERQKRVSKLNIQPLGPEVRNRFAAEWREVQARFVDEPKMAGGGGGRFVKRGGKGGCYSMAGFGERG